jgi:hypothetical protein
MFPVAFDPIDELGVGTATDPNAWQYKTVETLPDGAGKGDRQEKGTSLICNSLVCSRPSASGASDRRDGSSRGPSAEDGARPRMGPAGPPVVPGRWLLLP